MQVQSRFGGFVGAHVIKMSVLIECISVVVRKDTLKQRYPGGIDAYVDDLPNNTYCADEHLTRVGFMTPADVEAYVRKLTSHGLLFLQDGQAVDVSVIDQTTGPTAQCAWLEAGRHRDGYSAAWLAGTIPGYLAVPSQWTPDQSRGMVFVPPAQAHSRILQLARQDGLDVFLDFKTGRELYRGWPNPPTSR